MEITYRQDHIHIDHGSGFEINPPEMAEFWPMLSKLCQVHRCGRVLVEGEAPKRDMDTVSAFESGKEASEVYPDLWIALCFRGYEPDETSELFITAARNRGAKVKFFTDVSAAKRWLGIPRS